MFEHPLDNAIVYLKQILQYSAEYLLMDDEKNVLLLKGHSTYLLSFLPHLVLKCFATSSYKSGSVLS